VHSGLGVSKTPLMVFEPITLTAGKNFPLLSLKMACTSYRIGYTSFYMMTHKLWVLI
jgi:hypothetical protein